VNQFSSDDDDVDFGDLPVLSESPKGVQKIRIGDSITMRASANIKPTNDSPLVYTPAGRMSHNPASDSNPFA